MPDDQHVITTQLFVAYLMNHKKTGKEIRELK